MRNPIEAADDFILKLNRNKNVCAHPSSQSHTHMLTKQQDGGIQVVSLGEEERQEKRFFLVLLFETLGFFLDW